MSKLIKVNWDVILPILGLIFIFISTFLLAQHFIVEPFNLRVQQMKQVQQRCRQICGEYLVVHCNTENDQIVCDEHTRVQHFPK
jgi:hypothetical protein